MTLEHLKAVCAIVEKGTFSKAAEGLFITQPALSMQIKVLEDEIGVPVFERTGKRVVLTQAGGIVLEHARSILAGLNAMKKAIAELNGLAGGELSVAASDTVTRFLLMDALNVFRAKFPKITLRVWNRTSAEIVSMVAHGSTDIGVVTLPADAQGLVVDEMLGYEYIAVTSPANARRLGRLQGVAQLAGENLLLLEKGTRMRETVESVFRAQGVSMEKHTDLGSVDVQKDLAKIGAGIAIVPDFSVKKELKTRELKALDLKPVATGTIGIIRRKSSAAAAATQFLETLRAELAAAGHGSASARPRHGRCP